MLNPLFRRLRDLNREIARAEEHFGMTPLARLRLGVTFLQEQVAKEELAAKRERRPPHTLLRDSTTEPASTHRWGCCLVSRNCNLLWWSS